MEFQAYFEEWSLKPGDTVRMAASTAHPSVRATLVRLLSGPGTAPAIEGRTADRSDVLDTTFAGRLQATAVGSFATLPLPSPLQGQPVTVHCWIWPTVPARIDAQTVWSLGDAALVVRNGAIEVHARDATLVAIEDAIVAKHWYSIAVTLDGETATIDLKRLDGKVSALRDATGPAPVAVSADALTLAAAGVLETGSPKNPFNGKIDSPTLFAAAPTSEMLAAWRRGNAAPIAPWASWRLCEDFASETVSPTFAADSGRLVNGVERGVTGRNWDGTSDSFMEKPEHYCALQFHEDDMVEFSLEP